MDIKVLRHEVQNCSRNAGLCFNAAQHHGTDIANTGELLQHLRSHHSKTGLGEFRKTCYVEFRNSRAQALGVLFCHQHRHIHQTHDLDARAEGTTCWACPRSSRGHHVLGVSALEPQETTCRACPHSQQDASVPFLLFSPNAVMAPSKRGIGRCASAFWLAVSFDVLGAALLVCGLFVEVTFYDLLIYLGAIFIFLSIVWWIFWYTGNIEIPMCELDDRPRKPNAFRRLSRLSRRVAASFRQNSQRGQKDVSGRPRTTARGSDKRSDKRKGKKVTIQEPEKWRLRGAEVADELDQSTTQL